MQDLRLDLAHVVQHLIEELLRVDTNSRELRGQNIADVLEHEAEVFVDKRGRFDVLGLLQNLDPLVLEISEVGDDGFIVFPLRRGAHNVTARALFRILDETAKAGALLGRFNLARNTDVLDCGHVNEKPPREAHVRSDPGAFGAERFLGHLHEDLLPFFQ